MFRTVLVPLDGSPLSERALPLAATLARTANARLVLVRAAWVPHILDLESVQAEVKCVKEAEDYLAGIAAPLIHSGLTVETGVPFAAAGEGILMEAKLRQADIIIMSTHGRSGLSRLVYGSVAEAVLTDSPAPVLLIRATTDNPMTLGDIERPEILVPLDGSPFSETVLPYATEMARLFNGSLLLQRVVVRPPQWIDPMVVAPYPTEEVVARNDEEAHTYLLRLKAQLEAEGCEVRTRVANDGAADAILDSCCGSNVRLVVMATHCRHGLGRVMFGSVAMAVLHHARLPILLVHPMRHSEAAPNEIEDEGELEHAPG
ncbi:MAG: universal stress protein [Anaerolineae bacterium]